MEQTPVAIRRCTADDFEQIVPLFEQLWPGSALDVDALRKVFLQGTRSPTQEYICAAIGPTVVGFCSLTVKNNLWQAGNLGHIDELVVDARHRGAGIGTRLLAHIMEAAKARECRRVELDTAFHRENAHRFYERSGFERRAYLFSKVL